jgi:cyclophilin family peptidyl-prolyl cis-trans isomerase
MQNFPHSIFAIIDHITSQNTKQTLVVHFDKMHPKYRCEALSRNLIQGGALAIPMASPAIACSSMACPLRRTIMTTVIRGWGLLACANINGNIDSRYFVQTKDNASWADRKYAALGIVLDEGNGCDRGMDLVRRISRVEVKTPQNSPKEPITIVGCRILPGAET